MTLNLALRGRTGHTEAAEWVVYTPTGKTVIPVHIRHNLLIGRDNCCGLNMGVNMLVAMVMMVAMMGHAMTLGQTNVRRFKAWNDGRNKKS